MGALIGFAVGYYLGTRSGAVDVDELVEAWQAIKASDEFNAMKDTALAMAGDVLQRGMDTRREADRAALARAVVEGGVTFLSRRMSAA